MDSTYIGYALAILGIFATILFFYIQQRRRRLINYEIIHSPVFDGDVTPDEIEIKLRGEKIKGQLYYCKGAIINVGKNDISQDDLLGDGKFRINCPEKGKWIQNNIENHLNIVEGKVNEDSSLMLDFNLFKKNEAILYEGYYSLEGKNEGTKFSDEITPLGFFFRIKNIPNSIRTLSKKKLKENHIARILFLLATGAFFSYAAYTVIVEDFMHIETGYDEVQVYHPDESKNCLEEVSRDGDSIRMTFSDGNKEPISIPKEELPEICFKLRFEYQEFERSIDWEGVILLIISFIFSAGTLIFAFRSIYLYFFKQTIRKALRSIGQDKL